MVPEFEESEIPFARGPELFVRRLKAGQSITFAVLSDKFWGLRVHWDARGRRSFPHLRNKEACPGCKLGWPSKWKGYLHVLTGSGEEILEFTPAMQEQMLDQIGAGVSLRGQRFHMSRGAGDKARCKLSLQPHYSVFKGHAPLPAARDPKVSLVELWGLGNVRLGDEEPPSIPFPEAS